MKNKSLIIGANGFLANELAQILSETENLHGVFRSQINANRENCFQAQYLSSDLETIPNDFDTVYLLASFIPYSGMNKPDVRFIETNIDLVSRTVKHFTNCRLIFASSVAVYGNNLNAPLTESSNFCMPSLYGLSKIAGEAIVQNHKNFAVVRFSSIYGKNMNRNTFLPKITDAATFEKKVILYGDGSRRQDYLYVEDAANFCIAAAQSNENAIFLGANGKSVSNLEAALMLKKYLPDTEIQFHGVDNSPSFVYENDFTKNKLNFEVKHHLSQSIQTLIKNE
jgi:nucleoside-diphosphate-sugar epimerase